MIGLARPENLSERPVHSARRFSRLISLRSLFC
jgi:hypothetical protein